MQVRLIKEIIDKTKNLSIVGFLFTEIKQLIQEDARDLRLGVFSKISTIRSFLNQGAEKYGEMPLATRVEIFSHMLNLLLFLTLRFKNFWEQPDAAQRALKEAPCEDNLLNKQIGTSFFKETGRNLATLKKEFEDELEEMKKLRAEKKNEEDMDNNFARENEMIMLVENINRIVEITEQIDV